MRVCPKCGHIENWIWRPTTWKSSSLIDCCRVSDLEIEEPEFAKRLKEKKELIEGFYAYKITKTGVWVLRRWIDIWKVQGWKDIPAEKYRPPKIDPKQKVLIQ